MIRSTLSKLAFRNLIKRPLITSHALQSTATSVRLDESIGTSEIKPFSQIPGPKGLYDIPFIGTALHFKPFTNYVPDDLVKILMNMREKYGDIMKMRMGRDHFVITYHPDDAKTVFQLPYKEYIRKGLVLPEVFQRRTGIPRDLGTLQGEEWAALRKPSQEKMLRPAVVAGYVPLIEKVTNDFVSKLKQKESVDDLLMELMNYTGESIGMLCFNKRLGYLDNPNASQEIIQPIGEFFSCLQAQSTIPIKTFKYFRTKLYKRYEKANFDLLRITNREISAQREFLTGLEKDGKLDEYLQSEPNFMYSLMTDPRMTDQKANGLVFSLFIAGMDSTANTMAFVLINLALNPTKQERLHEEIQRIVGNSKSLTKEHLSKMSYLKACVKESQRLVFPLMLGPNRYLEDDIVLAGYHIPKGTIVLPNMSAMSLDGRFFPSPKEYIPERWMRDTDVDIAKGQDFPFGVKPFGFGPRSCIGQRFAETELYIGVTKIIQSFQISLSPGITEVKSKYRTFTTPAEKVKLHLKKRENVQDM